MPRDTLLFRLFNPELYIPYNRWIAGIGSVVCAAAIAKVAYLKYEFEAEKSRGRSDDERQLSSRTGARDDRDDEARDGDGGATDDDDHPPSRRNRARGQIRSPRCHPRAGGRALAVVVRRARDLDSIPTRGDDDKNAAAVPSTSAGDAKDVQGTAEERANKRKDLYMMFRRQVRDSPAKGFSRQAYENGVVIVRCPGCQVQHLVADRYGWFGEPGSVEDFLKGRGETVVTGKAGTEDDDGTLEIDRAQLEAWMAKQGVGATTNEKGES